MRKDGFTKNNVYRFSRGYDLTREERLDVLTVTEDISASSRECLAAVVMKASVISWKH